ncbi:MAG TPA: aldolase/citrate lyase family protein [Bacteroidales bacterium]|nr:aldolase/citrate lyase family protein [Bacteroidales bacterium]
MVYTSGNHGEGIRSDCFMSLEVLSAGGIQIDLRSKVKALYGRSITGLCLEMFQFFEIEHARLEIDDSGALPFTLAARLEAAINLLRPQNKEYLLPVLPQNIYSTDRDRDRITRLYLPGNNPKLMINAGIYGSDGIILDLEDAVSPEKKHEARILVRNALRSVDFYGAERMVRINQVPAGLDDLRWCIGHPVNLILIPKCESAEQVILTDTKITQILGAKNTSIFLMPILETACGILNAQEIAGASDQVVAMAIGLEDYTADIGVSRTPEGKESLFARNMLINAAVSAGKQPIDSVFSDFENVEAIARAASESRAMGFAGMGCIHPRQVSIIRENFLPAASEIDKARKIALAFYKAQEQGSSVVALESKMIDPPVVKRALGIIAKAVKYGKLQPNWRENNE